MIETWHKIADDADKIGFSGNNMAVVDVEGKKIGIARHGGKLFAFSNICPHAGGVLTDGWLDQQGNIVS